MQLSFRASSTLVHADTAEISVGWSDEQTDGFSVLYSIVLSIVKDYVNSMPVANDVILHSIKLGPV